MGINTQITLEDKYTVTSGRIYMSGIQALARIPMTQRVCDSKNGLNTAGFISGYRGSPVGTLDSTLFAARKHLEKHHVVFQPGINEDLAATAIWGSQQGSLFAGRTYDGVCGYWYGKGPGVDRSGDVFRHANMAGTSRNGGVVLFSGDDHAAKSSTVPNQTDYAYMDLQIPILYPANVQEVLDYGIMAMQMSRYSGCWVALKCLAEVMDSSSTIEVGLDRHTFLIPDHSCIPESGVHIRIPDSPLEQEHRLIHHKIPAALAFARHNHINRTVFNSPKARLGIISTGKSWLDTLQALDDLGIDETTAAGLGLRLYKVGMPWPLEPEGILKFAQGLEHIVIVEEKRPVIENQIKELLYNHRLHTAPDITGKYSPCGKPAFQATGELGPGQIAIVLGTLFNDIRPTPSAQKRMLVLEQTEKNDGIITKRIPYFCAGCPHNTSTRVPEGSRAIGGIGCHYMVTWMDRETSTFTHMGGEGVPWVGQAPFTSEKHIFANLGDGTYYHSGLLAIRQAVAANITITYRILFNDAVAMTGGQAVDGPLSVHSTAAQVAAEGVKRIAVVSDEPGKHRAGSAFPSAVTFHYRNELEHLQRQFRDTPGVSIIIYDQTCAAEKRRRLKQGKMPDPNKRIFINDLICEGCGDCGIQSNCVAIEPLETEFGRKRQIDQSSCNKDFSCINGFCPSFVTVSGGKIRHRQNNDPGHFESLKQPCIPPVNDRPYDIVITGIGGTGIITISALLGMAAHLEGMCVVTLDQIGLAQKNGSVFSHLRIARSPKHIHAARISPGNANLVLGCDGLTAGSRETILKTRPGYTSAVINIQETMSAEFTRNPDLAFPGSEIIQHIKNAIGIENTNLVDASRLATGLMGDSLATNLFLVGYAWQKGLIPLSEEAILKAIELNSIKLEFNRQSFIWGRRAAVDPEQVAALVGSSHTAPQHIVSKTLDEVIFRRSKFLENWQNAAWANLYLNAIEQIHKAERKIQNDRTPLTEAAARSLFKLMAYKDEYEVARLYTDGTFLSALHEHFEGNLKLTFHMAPPFLGRRNPETGQLEKSTFGSWVFLVMRLLAQMRRLRGSRLDLFGYTEERRMQRQLIADFKTLLSDISASLSAKNIGTAVKLASLPLSIRGYGHVLERNVKEVQQQQEQLMNLFRKETTELAATE